MAARRAPPYLPACVAPAGFHGLRHAWATMLAAGGASIATISRLLAHSPHSAQAMRYQHPDTAQLVEAVAAVQKALTTAKA